MCAFRLGDFTGGLNKTGDLFLSDNEAVELTNCVFDNVGTLCKRKGYYRINEEPLDSNPISSLHVFNPKSGDGQILAVSASGIWSINKGTGVVKNLKNDLDCSVPFQLVTWLDKCYIINGVEPLQEFDGESFTVVEGAPVGRYIAVKDNVMYIAGDPAHPSRLYYSEIADPTGWKGIDEITNHIEVSTDDGDYITGLTVQHGNLVIFKNYKIYILYGTDASNYVLKEMQSSIGCTASRSIVNLFNTLFFLAKDGVYSFDGINVALVSTKIAPEITRILLKEKVQAVGYNGLYMLSFAEGDSLINNRILAYDVYKQAWTYFTGIYASCFANFDSVNGYLYFGDSRTGLIHKLMPQDEEIYHDDGVNIELRYTTKNFDLDSPEVEKRFRNILIELQCESDFFVSLVVDKGKASWSTLVPGQEGANPKFLWGALWGTMTWHENAIKALKKSISGGTHGSKFYISLRNSSKVPLKVFSITLDIQGLRQNF